MWIVLLNLLLLLTMIEIKGHRMGNHITYKDGQIGSICTLIMLYLQILGGPGITGLTQWAGEETGRARQ